jgi:hypothetical protein
VVPSVSIHLFDAPTEDLARYVLVLDTINFVSGRFPTLAVADGGRPPTRSHGA